jgi:hypothetical protein
MVFGAFSPWACAAVYLPVGMLFVVSLPAFVISFVWRFVFRYLGLLRGVQVVSPRNMGISCKHSRYGILLHWHLESHTSESWSVFAFVKTLDIVAGEHVVS